MKKSQQIEKEDSDNQPSETENNADRFVIKIPGFSLAYEDGVFQIELPVFTFEISIHLFLRFINWIKAFYEKCVTIVRQHTVISTIILVVSITMISGMWYVRYNETKTQDRLSNSFTLLGAGCINDASPWLTTLKPDTSNQDILTAQRLLLTNQLDQSEHLLMSILQKNTTNEKFLSFCHYALGRIMLIKENYSDAKKYFDTAISKNPSFSMALLAKGLTLEKQGFFQNALEQYNASLAITEQHCQNLDSNHHYRIAKVLCKRLQTITDCENSDDCRLKLTFDIEKLLKQRRKQSDTEQLKSSYRVMFLSLRQTGFNFSYTGESIYWSDLFTSHAFKKSEKIRQVDSLMVYGLLKRLELPYHSVNNPKIALNLSRYLPVDFIISGNVTQDKLDKIISVKVLNALTGDIVGQLSDKLSGNRIEDACKRLASQLFQLILNYKNKY
jgi:tetratricopeptide (TPR) repeat protein